MTKRLAILLMMLPALSAAAQGFRLTPYKSPSALYLNVERLYSYNRYEKSRLELGLQWVTPSETAEHPRMFIGQWTVKGYVGYGFGDKALKYGGGVQLRLPGSNDLRFYLKGYNYLEAAASRKLEGYRLFTPDYNTTFLASRYVGVKGGCFDVSIAPSRKWSMAAGVFFNREDYRFKAADGSSVIGCIGTSRDENHAFIYLARHFTKRQLPVPKVLAATDDELHYLQTDLGTVSLYDAIRGGREAGGRYTLAEQELLKRTIRQLPNIQLRGARGLDFSQCYPQPEFDKDSVLFDLNYFKYCFLKATELDFHELKLEADFRLLAKDLTQAGDEQCFLYRDFQARNVMLNPPPAPPEREGRPNTNNMSSPPAREGLGVGQPFFIDFQGGRRGPYYYDLASF